MTALEIIQLIEFINKLWELYCYVQEILDLQSHTDPVPIRAGEGRVGGLVLTMIYSDSEHMPQYLQ